MTIKDSLRLSLVATAIMVTANASSAIDGDDLPPAKPGQCFTKAFFPAKYTTTTERVLASEPSEKVITIPAKYGYTTEKIKVSDGTERVITTPATYKTVYSKVMSNLLNRLGEHLLTIVHLKLLILVYNQQNKQE